MKCILSYLSGIDNKKFKYNKTDHNFIREIK